MSAYVTTHHFSPRSTSRSRQSHNGGQSQSQPHPLPMTSTAITAPTIAPPKSSTATASPSSSHHHLGLDTLARFLHAFNAHSEDDTAAERVTHHDVFHPHFDLLEDKTTYTIYGELPGLGKGEVTVEANDPLFMVTVSGRLTRLMPPKVEDTTTDDVGVVHGADRESSAKGKSTETGATEDNKDKNEPGAQAENQDSQQELQWHVTERRVGQFRRAFQFPVETVDMGAVSASMHNGLLCVVVPKKTGGRDVGEERRVDVD